MAQLRKTAFGAAITITGALSLAASAKAGWLDGEYPIQYDKIMALVKPGTPNMCMPVGTAGPITFSGGQSSWPTAHGVATGTVSPSGYVEMTNPWGQKFTSKGNFTAAGGTIMITNPSDRCADFALPAFFGPRQTAANSSVPTQPR